MEELLLSLIVFVHMLDKFCRRELEPTYMEKEATKVRAIVEMSIQQSYRQPSTL